jgi:hypothetical protein
VAQVHTEKRHIRANIGVAESVVELDAVDDVEIGVVEVHVL